jgi:hypothetical protein
MKKNIKIVLVLFFISTSVATVFAKVAVPPTALLVTTSSDTGAGSLREAITTANTNFNPPYTIEIDAALTGQTLTLLGNLPDITVDLTITGLAGSTFTISGDNTYTMFNVASGKTLTISGFTLTNNTSGNGNIFNAVRSNVIASDMLITGNTQNKPFFCANNATITFSNSNFTDNSSFVLFASDWGNIPATTSNTETDYTNRITVTGSAFSLNSGKIFRTERYVKIDDCVFSDNTGQIGEFRGENRYQVLNSTFENNTYTSGLFTFAARITEPRFSAFDTNHHLFDGNTFTGNTGTIINPGNTSWQSKTTISNNVFSANATKWSGIPAVVTGNTHEDFITSVVHDADNSSVVVTINTAVFNTNMGPGALEANDFEFSLTGGTATLGSSIPTSISKTGNVYTLGINVTGPIDSTEALTVAPIADSVYDASANKASTTQKNSDTNLFVPVTFVTKHGEITSSNPNTVNANGALGTEGGVDENGKSTILD